MWNSLFSLKLLSKTPLGFSRAHSGQQVSLCCGVQWNLVQHRPLLYTDIHHTLAVPSFKITVKTKTSVQVSETCVRIFYWSCCVIHTFGRCPDSLVFCWIRVLFKLCVTAFLWISDWPHKELLLMRDLVLTPKAGGLRPWCRLWRNEGAVPLPSLQTRTTGLNWTKQLQCRELMNRGERKQLKAVYKWGLWNFILSLQFTVRDWSWRSSTSIPEAC